MAKKKNLKKLINKYAIFAITLFTIVSFVMVFVTNIQYSNQQIGFKMGVKGSSAIFSWKNGDTVLSNFSFMTLLAYLLPIIGLILSFLFNKRGVLFNIIAVACFIASALLAFLIPNFVVLTDMGKIYTFGLDVSIGVGAVILAIMSILSALVKISEIIIK